MTFVMRPAQQAKPVRRHSYETRRLYGFADTRLEHKHPLSRRKRSHPAIVRTPVHEQLAENTVCIFDEDAAFGRIVDLALDGDALCLEVVDRGDHGGFVLRLEAGVVKAGA